MSLIPARSILLPNFYFLLFLAALIESFFSAEIIAFPAEFALRCRRAGALFARTRRCPRKLLSLT